MRTYLLFAWLPSMLILTMTSAKGFEPDRHEEYTKIGIKAYEECVRLDTPFPAIDPFNDLAQVATGTKNEDDIGIRRATHWHYAHNSSMWRQFWFFLFPIDLSLDNIFLERVDAMHQREAYGQTLSRKDIFERAGRVLHYIQDMRVPAHVIPIHHGGFPVFIDEEVDKFEFSYPEWREPRNNSDAWRRKWRDKCNAIADAVGVPHPSDLRILLDRARKATDQMLAASDRQAVKNPVTRCWREVIWCKPENHKECPGSPYPGFGAYLGGDNAIRFGEEKTVLCQGQAVQFRTEDYLDFFYDAYESMIEDTLFVLLYVVRLTNGKLHNLSDEISHVHE